MMSRSLLPIVLALALAGPALAADPGGTMKIGVFDPEVLWKQTEVGKKYNQDLSAARDRLQAQIDKKTEDVEALKSRLRQQQQSLSEDKINDMKKEIVAKQTELERLNEDATKEMKYQLGETQGRFQEMLMKTLEVFGKEKAFSLIVDRSVAAFSAPGIRSEERRVGKEWRSGGPASPE